MPEKNKQNIFEILMTYSFQIDDRYLTLVILFTMVTLVTLFWSYNQFYRPECVPVSGFLHEEICCFWHRNLVSPGRMLNFDTHGSSSRVTPVFVRGPNRRTNKSSPTPL